METVDKAASLPIYRQVIHALWESVQRRELRAGQRAPSERELADRYGISRMTARAALRELINDGVLYTVHGKGTFVTQAKVQQPLNRLTSFTEDMRARGLAPGARVLSQGVEPASLHVAERLRLVDGAPVVVIRRLRLADDEPMSVETVHLDAGRFESILHHDLARESLYNILAARGVTLAWSDQWLEATIARAADSEILCVPRGSALLRIERTSYDAAEQPVEFVNSLYRADRYRFNARLQREDTIVPERWRQAVLSDGRAAVAQLGEGR